MMLCPQDLEYTILENQDVEFKTFQGFSWHFHSHWLLQVGKSRLLIPEDQQADTGVTKFSCDEELRGGTMESLHPSMTR